MEVKRGGTAVTENGKALVALVTGASAGIGRATARALAREGAKVVLAARRVRECEELVETIRSNSGEAIFVQTDVSKADQVARLVRRTVENFGRLDWACNNAAVEGTPAPIHELTEEDWDHVLDINLKGVWLCMKYEIDQMLKHGGGAIVNISSINGLVGAASFAPYTASKHGVLGLTKSAAKAYAVAGIRINAICPGSIHTPMIERVDGGPAGPDSWRIARTPMSRIGDPEEIAEAVLWLCSSKASYVTGHSMLVDGGLLA